MMDRHRLSVALIALAALLVPGSGDALAAFPGQDGNIAFERAS
jgi:hypothetical protein